MTDNSMYMPVAPANNGGGFGGDWAWIILLLLLGWGNSGFGGGNNGYNSQMANGFQNQYLGDGLNSVRDGLQGISTQLYGGFAGIEQGANARQIADMQTAFAAQTAMAQGFAGLQSQFAQCCCDNRLATVQTQNIVQSEGAATRLAIQNQTQQILDKMCAQEIDALKAQNVSLQNQLNMANLAASQTAQTIALEQYLKPATTT